MSFFCVGGKSALNANAYNSRQKWYVLRTRKNRIFSDWMSLTKSEYQVLKKKEIEKQKNLLIVLKFDKIPWIRNFSCKQKFWGFSKPKFFQPTIQELERNQLFLANINEKLKRGLSEVEDKTSIVKTKHAKLFQKVIHYWESGTWCSDRSPHTVFAEFVCNGLSMCGLWTMAFDFSWQYSPKIGKRVGIWEFGEK